MTNYSWYTLLLLSCFLPGETVAQEMLFFPSQVSFSGGVLCWTAKQSGLDYTTKPLPVFTTTDFANSGLVGPSVDWKAGFRLAADWGSANEPCSLGLHVLNYAGAANGSQTASSIDGIFPTLSFANDTLATDYATSAQQNWALHTTIFDIVSAYKWNANRSFSVISSIALRSAWISQHISASYSGATFSAGPDNVNLRSSFYGVGPRIAIGPRFRLQNGFSIYGEAGGAVLCSWFNVHQTETFLSATRGSLHRRIQGLRWNADATTGITWEGCSNGWTSYIVDLGFDFLYFSDQYAFKHAPQFNLQSQDNYLMLYGVHLSAGLRF